jgi:hypothetical protein
VIEAEVERKIVNETKKEANQEIVKEVEIVNVQEQDQDHVIDTIEIENVQKQKKKHQN